MRLKGSGRLENPESELSKYNKTSVLNALYTISKFIDELQSSDIKPTIYAESYYDKDFARRVKRLTGEPVYEIEKEFVVNHNKSNGTVEVSGELISILNFIEQFDKDYRQRDSEGRYLSGMLDDIFEYDTPVYALNNFSSSFDLSDDITISDQVSDIRQTDFFSELGMSDEDMKEAKEMKKYCKGGN